MIAPLFLLLCGEKVVYLPQNMRRIVTVLSTQEQENMYLWENKNWPNFQWDEQKINELLVRVRHQQGRLLGMADTLGFDVKSPVVLDAMTSDIIKSSEIEGIALNADDVRSSVAWQLGIDRVGVPSSDRYIEGVVEVMFDAVHHYDEPLTQERLFGWHCALFPNPGRLAHITVGDWRQGNMQVVSGQYGKEKVHYEAPAGKDVPQMMSELLQWINTSDADSVLKAAIAHLWFVSIHPFSDGNGRLARTITDMFLAKSDATSYRFYSMSTQDCVGQERILRHFGTDTEGVTRHYRVAPMVSRKDGNCHQCGYGDYCAYPQQGHFLGKQPSCGNERAADQDDQYAVGRF